MNTDSDPKTRFGGFVQNYIIFYGSNGLFIVLEIRPKTAMVHPSAFLFGNPVLYFRISLRLLSHIGLQSSFQVEFSRFSKHHICKLRISLTPIPKLET